MEVFGHDDRRRIHRTGKRTSSGFIAAGFNPLSLKIIQKM